jgi:hypothetical protein
MRKMSIKIVETIEDKKSLFNIKRFKYKNYSVETILKTTDTKNLKLPIFKSLFKRNEDKLVFETSKEISNIEVLDEEEKFKSYLKIPRFLSGYPHNLILTFNLSSSQLVEEISKATTFFDMMYGYSEWLFVPDIRPRKYIKIDKNKSKLVEIISSKEYIKYVDSICQILNYRNSKPIFVPISIKFHAEEIREVVSHYLKRERFYIWINFDGRPINEETIGRMRHIYRIIEESGRLKDTLIYITNIKREILSNVKDIKTPASYVLTSIVGGNIIGVNKEPKRVIEGSGQPKYSKEELLIHKGRKFNKETYYYEKPTDLNFDIKYVLSRNNILLQHEFDKQCEKFIIDRDIKEYILSKEMAKKDSRGRIVVERLFSIKKKPNLRSWI